MLNILNSYFTTCKKDHSVQIKMFLMQKISAHPRPIVVAICVDVKKILFRVRLQNFVLDYTKLNKKLYLYGVFVKNE